MVGEQESPASRYSNITPKEPDSGIDEALTTIYLPRKRLFIRVAFTLYLGILGCNLPEAYAGDNDEANKSRNRNTA